MATTGAKRGHGEGSTKTFICFCNTNCKPCGGVPVSRTTLWRHKNKDLVNGFTIDEDTSSGGTGEFQGSPSSSDDDFYNYNSSTSSGTDTPPTYEEQVERARQTIDGMMEAEEASEEEGWAQDVSEESISSWSGSSTTSVTDISDIDDDELPINNDLANEELQKYIDWIDLITGITRKSGEKMTGFFEKHYPDINLPTIYRINTILEKRTGIKPQWYDCCINSCMAFTGEFDLD